MSKYAKAKIKEKKIDPFGSPICYLMAICPFLMGLVQEYWILWSALVVLVVLLLCAWQKREIRLHMNPAVYVGLAMLVLSILSVFTGMLHGEAVYGALRILCAAIWVLLLMQLSDEEKSLSLTMVPEVAAVMTIISALLFTMGSAAEFVFSHGRMGGFFQYANTFALYLLLAFVIRTNQNTDMNPKDKKEQIKKYLYPVIYLIGILWSGSRTTFFLTAIVLVMSLFRRKEMRKYYGTLILVGMLAVIAYVLLTGKTDSIGRFLTTSLSSSTLVGRILYWKDALKLIVQHPFGLGYMGYYFIQGKVQSGVYTVAYVHNEWLQMALDFGILFWVCFVVLFVYQIRHTKGMRRDLLLLIGIHMIMDFDLQYFTIVWLMLLCMNWTEGKTVVWELEKKKYRKPLVMVGSVMWIAVSIWLGLGNMFYEFENYATSVLVYPWSIRAQERYLLAANTEKEYEERAKRALELYAEDAPALDVMALCEAERGNYLKVEEYKHHSLLVQKYRTECYDDYIMMMDTGAQQYKETGDEAAYKKCVEAILSTPKMLEKVKENTSSLAYKINDKPSFELSAKSQKIMRKYQ